MIRITTVTVVTGVIIVTVCCGVDGNTAGNNLSQVGGAEPWILKLGRRLT